MAQGQSERGVAEDVACVGDLEQGWEIEHRVGTKTRQGWEGRLRRGWGSWKWASWRRDRDEWQGWGLDKGQRWVARRPGERGIWEIKCIKIMCGSGDGLARK